MFMERASSQVIAANIAAGDFRSALGVRSNDDRYWAGVYVTGPTSGSNHANTTGGTGGNGEPLGAFGRVGFQALQAPDYSVHVGVDAAGLMKPSTTGGVRTITLSDRPELRIDPTSIITTPGAGTGGALGTVANPLSDAAVFGVELAGGYQNLFFQSEGFNYRIDRQGLPANTFWGGYVEGSWTVTGEHRNYVPAAGAYSGIVPAHPFSPSAGQWGAFELAARYSYIDLDDNIGSAAAAAATPVTTALKTNGVAGGRQQVWTLGVNWYPNSNLRFTLDYLHGVIDKPGTAAASVFSEAGANFDAFAMRTQFAF
jgi:phosphate-selective porin OprO/OprP